MLSVRYAMLRIRVVYSVKSRSPRRLGEYKMELDKLEIKQLNTHSR